MGDILSVIELYCEAIKDLFDINQEIEFPVYVFQKDNIVIQKEKETKDGLHLVFGIQMKHNIQMLLRNIVIQKERNEMQLFLPVLIHSSNISSGLLTQSSPFSP